jgi:hypothetical protein
VFVKGAGAALGPDVDEATEVDGDDEEGDDVDGDELDGVELEELEPLSSPPPSLPLLPPWSSTVLLGPPLATDVDGDEDEGDEGDEVEGDELELAIDVLVASSSPLPSLPRLPPWSSTVVLGPALATVLLELLLERS